MYKKFINRLFIISTIVLYGIFSPAFAQAPDTLWTKTFGGNNIDEALFVEQTSDSGFIITGYTNSYGAGSSDLFLVRTNQFGDTLWQKTFGGSSTDEGYCVHQTSDGGYIIAGSTYSFGNSFMNTWLIKTDEFGDTLWTKTYGGNNYDYGYSVQQTADGGYIVVGGTASFGAGNYDVFLIRTDQFGDTLWTKTYGGIDYDVGVCVQQTSDSGYIITGVTTSFGAGNDDVYCIRTNQDGDTLWTKTYGGIENDNGNFVQQTFGGGFIIIGNTRSMGAGSSDILLLRITTNGNVLWTKTYGGINPDFGNSVQQLSTGGFILCGKTGSYGAGGYDAWIIRTSNNGDTLWTKTIGTGTEENGNFVCQTFDEGFIIAGLASSIDINGDFWLIQLNPEGIIPVELTSFSATVSDGDVNLNWVTATELNNSGFEIQRFALSAEPQAWVKIGFVNGNGTSSEVHNYSYKDQNPFEGTSYYRLKQIDLDGTFSYSNEVEIEVKSPQEFTLAQNYPNPFNPSTKISWQSPVSSWQTLKVYDVLGNGVVILVDEYKPAGNYEVQFDAANLPSGVYFYQLQAGNYTGTKKLILTK
ncbi:T9SS type A sorting domain-containing protein [Ignavibacterium album]|uniref:T9SS type A sorting domain-containing protein n=1 Tax=Ignavibacterium album TaxID=591197 RepID=UPI0026EE90E9|nr:T9SS type A sorting domain-containing protein [Ignavibacterium album]